MYLCDPKCGLGRLCPHRETQAPPLTLDEEFVSLEVVPSDESNYLLAVALEERGFVTHKKYKICSQEPSKAIIISDRFCKAELNERAIIQFCGKKILRDIKSTLHTQAHIPTPTHTHTHTHTPAPTQAPTLT
jgi:hypothetical protein